MISEYNNQPSKLAPQKKDKVTHLYYSRKSKKKQEKNCIFPKIVVL
jgi:hypothetical protein